VISLAGQPGKQPDLKKPTALRGVVGVWDCESSGRIKGLWRYMPPRCWLPRRSWRLEHNQCHGLFLLVLRSAANDPHRPAYGTCYATFTPRSKWHQSRHRQDASDGFRETAERYSLPGIYRLRRDV